MSTIKRISDYHDRVINHYETGTSRGVDTGFNCLDQLLSFKPGYATFFLGFAGAGKTELHLEMLFNQTERYGWKHALMSGEIGTIEDVIGELVSKYLRKPFFRSNPYAATEREVHQALTFLDEFFYPVDGDEFDHTIDSFFTHCNAIEKDFKIKLNTTSIDPWNDLEEDLSKFAGREDKYLTWALRKVRQTAKKNTWHNMIVTHARDMPPIALKSVTGGEVYCTSIPTLQSFAGGQVWGRRAFNVVGVWRPEEGAINPVDSLPFRENEAIVLVLKSKPKGVGKKGKCSLYFDWKVNRYFEDFMGRPHYAYDHARGFTELQPSKEFDNVF